MEEKPIVSIEDGQLLGKICSSVRGGHYYSFQGIPYAKPPIGKLRFKAPQHPEAWTGIKDATKEGNESVSRHYIFKTVVGSEDCLFLNVYTPQLSSPVPKPVMVWIHGGAFVGGSGNSDFYGPDFLITEDVVIVTLNYRLGLLGFLSFEDTNLGVPGNAGLKDQVMALQWVKRNIKYFGGNLNDVTIFGESAGGASVHYLLLSPLSKGLFHKAIIQSGTALSCWARGQRSATLISKALELNTSDETEILKLLNNMTAEEIFNLQEKIPDPLVCSKMRSIGPVVENTNEGAFLLENPMDILISGKFNTVPIIIGYTSREGMLSEGNRVAVYEELKLKNNFEYFVPHMLNIANGSELSKECGEKIKKFYYGNNKPCIEDVDQFYKLETDNLFLHSIYTAIKLHARNSTTPIYFYRMSVESKLNVYKNYMKIQYPGVSHADDIGYLFNNPTTPEMFPQSTEDIAVKRFVKLWTNFARTGDPNPKKKDALINIEWIPVEEERMNYIDIGENLTVGIDPDHYRMEFWDNIYENYAKPYVSKL